MNKSETKFQPGDVVVITHKISDNDFEVGTTLVIKDLYTHNIKLGYSYSVEGTSICYYDSQIEHEHIYNSPLYKALS